MSDASSPNCACLCLNSSEAHQCSYFQLTLKMVNKYLVTCGERKKLVEGVGVRDLKSKCRVLFAVPNGTDIDLELYDEDFGDYAEVSEANSLPSKAKLRMLLKYGRTDTLLLTEQTLPG